MVSQLLPLLYKMSGHAVFYFVGIGIVAVDFTNQVTLGSIILSFVIIAVAGVFTVRSKIANIWREEAEGERAAKERCQDELAHERAARVEFDKQQQELRHQLKNEVVGLRAQLQVLEAKTDLTSAVRAITEVSEASSRHVAESLGSFMREQVHHSERRDERTHALLVEIRDKLPNEPIRVQAHDVLPVHETDRRKS